jgi:hypothetical protein
MRSPSRAIFACALAVAPAGALGCAGNVEVTRTYTPQAAAELHDTKLEPVAIVRGADRIPLPPGARVAGDRVVVPAHDGEYVHKLAPGDVLETDEQGRIVAVRSSSDPPVVTRFEPGTASSPNDSDVVRGVLEGTAKGEPRTIPLQPSDGVVMHGSFAPDEQVPGGGRVKSSRSTDLLVAGILVSLLGYAPAAYAGVASHRPADRVLLVPYAGPWIDLAGRDKCVPPAGSQMLPIDPCIGETAARAALVVGGAVQGLGAVLVLVGLAGRSQLVTDEDRGVGHAPPKPHVAVVPTIDGAAAVGTF